MYEAKYSKYIYQSRSRFAFKNEIKDVCTEISRGCRNNGSGPVLCYEYGKLYVDDSDTHYYIEGGTGSKKTRVAANNIIKSCIHSKQNVVVNDPKGELYKTTAGYASLCGYNIKVINFRDYRYSTSWNPLHLAKIFEKEGKTVQAAEVIDDFRDAVVTPLLERTNDRYWCDMAGDVFVYSSKLLFKTVSEEYFNLTNIIPFSSQENVSILNELYSNMDKSSEIAMAMDGIVNLTAEKTTGCIFSTVRQMYQPFIRNKALISLLSCNSFDMRDLTDKKTIVYVIFPDEKRGYDFLVNLFYIQCYQYLIEHSTSSQNGQGYLSRRVNFVLDEFSNMPPILKFENKISQARGYNIRFFLIGQNYGQLEKNYKENAQTIIDNCEWMIFASKDIEFFKRISEMCGMETDSYGREHPLVEACDLLHLKKFKDGAEALIIKSGLYPFVTKLPDYEYHNVFENVPNKILTPVIRHNKPKYMSFNKWLSTLDSIGNL